MSRLRYDLFILPLCFQDFQFGSLPCPIFCLSWLLANRQGDGEKQWWRHEVVCIAIPKCFSVGWLSLCGLSVSHSYTSPSLYLSLSVPLSLSLPGVKLVLNASVLSSLSHRIHNWSRAWAFWVFRLFKGQWWNRQLFLITQINVIKSIRIQSLDTCGSRPKTVRQTKIDSKYALTFLHCLLTEICLQNNKQYWLSHKGSLFKNTWFWARYD